jgi:hypothetical protein
MFLPDFILETRKNQCWNVTGLDNIDKCLDKVHYKNYPHQITYKYNSRGFRDQEWPESLDELQNSVWCIGDSFTVGIGSPLAHTWVNVLQSRLNQRCINVSLDGASNKWIARKTIDVLNIVRPKLIVIQWSYTHRDELPNALLSDEERRLMCGVITDINQLKINNIKLINQVELHKKECKIIHSFIPDSALLEYHHNENIWPVIKADSWPQLPTSLHEFNSLPANVIDELKTFNVYDVMFSYYQVVDSIIHIPEIMRIDLARDGLHYDILTATNFVDQVEDLSSDLLLS